MSLARPSGYKNAIIESDKLLDYFLKSKLGSQGTMGNRLKRAKNIFPSRELYDQAWKLIK